ncbi:MAG TPA: hypothetical protein PLQ56_22085 [Aggregatilineales bacterium]|nr:hypothetical protein [Aggregatilineales bacterium]
MNTSPEQLPDHQSATIVQSNAHAEDDRRPIVSIKMAAGFLPAAGQFESCLAVATARIPTRVVALR